MSGTPLNRKNRENSGRKRKEDSALGKFYDQEFYLVNYQPGRVLDFPFSSQPFNAFISIVGEYPTKILRQIAFSLLKQGMRFALCHGEAADTVATIIDDIIDEHHFSHEGFTAYTSSHPNETMEEAMEYFMLPNGLAETSIILVIGDAEARQEAIKTFAKIAANAGKTAADSKKTIAVSRQLRAF